MQLTMPALFVGHGSPMNALEDNEFSRAWKAAAAALPRPAAVLCVSAHWETDGTRVSSAAEPETIHDFGGFPRALHEFRYPAPGAPEMAAQVKKMVRGTPVALEERGLDHGAWSVLARLFPEADVPVAQLSLDRRKTPAAHVALARELRRLRGQGILILGTGNIAHNLGMMRWEDEAFDWAAEFDATIKRLILAGDIPGLAAYEKLGPAAGLAVPSADHFLPLLYILALKDDGEPVSLFTEKVTLGSMSMTSVRIG